MYLPARALVADALRAALAGAAAAKGWQGAGGADIDVEVPANPEHGDYATSVAMRLAKTVRRSPREIAAAIVEHVERGGPIASVEIAGGGFVNVRLDDAW